LGLIGKADVVEFHGVTPFPVEYKHGSKREREHDDLQLCAQAICLEEMTGKAVTTGAIFYHSSRRRREVEFSERLRSEVEAATHEIRKMLSEKTIPPPVNDSRCRHCSLKESCMPAVVGEKARAAALLRDLFVPI
jgi:CRISPR-associated exonuclease Cas4